MIFEKKCGHCGEVLPVEMFHKNKNTATGYSSYCKVCKRAHDASDVMKHSEKRKASGKRWREENRVHKSRVSKEYRLNNKESIKQKNKDYYLANSDKIKHRSVVWRAENKERFTNTVNNWRKLNKVRLRKIRKRWADSNPEFSALKASVYRAKKLKATPLWLEDSHYSEMLDLYTAAKMFQLYTGNEYHVDHIVPLLGDIVCGLHVPWNLQLLSSFENQSKGNRYWPDMPEPE
jgi:hypothetical protein